MQVFAAFNSVPDYTAPSPPLVSLHLSLRGAINALYPDNPNFQEAFTNRRMNEWVGPDGFGLVKKLEVLA